MRNLLVVGGLACLTLGLGHASARAEQPIRAPVEIPQLGLHLFGADSRGEPLIDKLLAGEPLPLVDCDDTQAKSLVKDGAAGAPRAPVKADENGIVKDKDLWLRRKFGCILKDALGRQRDWRDRGKAEPLEFVFMFNGGLNSQKSVTELARASFVHVLEERRYPIFMIWPTGGLDAYGENLFGVRNADALKLGNPLDWLTGVSQLASDSVKGVAALPKTFENGVRYNQGFRDVLDVGTAASKRRAEQGKAPTARLNVSYSDAVDDPFGKVDLPVTPLSAARPGTMALSEIGLAAWSNMVRRTRTAIHAVSEFPAQSQPEGRDLDPSGTEAVDCRQNVSSDSYRLRTCFPLGAGAFSRFFHWYQACADPRPPTVESKADVCPLTTLTTEDRLLLKAARFSLVGHSMGAIVINELVSSYPSMPYANIVFMAGADSVRSTRKTIAPLLAKNAGCTRFYNLMLHPRNDAGEQMAFGVLPRGSLLEYIDHYLDPPKSIDDRTIGKWTNIVSTKHMFAPAAQQWMLFHVFDRRARGTSVPTRRRGDPTAPHTAKTFSDTPVKHGGFNDEGVWFWTESFWNPQGVRFATRPRSCSADYLAPG